MTGFEDGKNMLRSAQIGERRRFFDKMHEDVDIYDIQYGSFEKKEKNKKKKNDLEDENELEVMAKAEKILKKILENKFREIVYKRRITNVRGKKLLNAEITALSTLIGKGIIEDEYIVSEVEELIKEGKDIVLHGAYKNKINDLFSNISTSYINELLFDFYINGEIEKEIAKLKNAIEEKTKTIFPKNIKEINEEAVFGLKQKILKELDKTSLVKKDFLEAKEKNPALAIKDYYKEEILNIIHMVIKEEMLADEISIPLNVSKNEIMEKKDDTEGLSGENILCTDIENINENVIETDNEKREELKKAFEECEKNNNLLMKRFLELRHNAVVDDEVMDVLAFQKEKINPIINIFGNLKQKFYDGYKDGDELLRAVKTVNEEFLKVLFDAESMIDKHEAAVEFTRKDQKKNDEKESSFINMSENLTKEEQSDENGVEFMSEQEIFKTTLEIVNEFKNNLFEQIKNNREWKKIRAYYQNSFLEGQIVAFLDELIEQEGIVSQDKRDLFVGNVLKEIMPESNFGNHANWIDKDKLNEIVENLMSGEKIRDDHGNILDFYKDSIVRILTNDILKKDEKIDIIATQRSIMRDGSVRHSGEDIRMATEIVELYIK